MSHGRMVALVVAAVIWSAAVAVAAGAEAKSPIRVAADGGGDYRTVQAAVDAVPAGGHDRVVIQIKPGTYKERIRVGRDKGPITFRGEDGHARETVLTFNYSARSVE